jgi:hypothetical protein
MAIHQCFDDSIMEKKGSATSMDKKGKKALNYGFPRQHFIFRRDKATKIPYLWNIHAVLLTHGDL